MHPRLGVFLVGKQRAEHEETGLHRIFAYGNNTV